MVAIGVFTATSAVASGTRILPSVPSSTASTSIVALSVSISAITSPGFTFSPSFFSHLARLPFSIVGESAGIRMLIGMAICFSVARLDGVARLGCVRAHVLGEGLDDTARGLFLGVLRLDRVDLREMLHH